MTSVSCEKTLCGVGAGTVLTPPPDLGGSSSENAMACPHELRSDAIHMAQRQEDVLELSISLNNLILYVQRFNANHHISTTNF
jgi:hypothetical protein